VTTFRACSSPAPTRVKSQPAPAILSQESVHTTLSITHHTRNDHPPVLEPHMVLNGARVRRSAHEETYRGLYTRASRQGGAQRPRLKAYRGRQGVQPGVGTRAADQRATRLERAPRRLDAWQPLYALPWGAQLAGARTPRLGRVPRGGARAALWRPARGMGARRHQTHLV
jgi:hypothetical protein